MKSVGVRNKKMCVYGGLQIKGELSEPCRSHDPTLEARSFTKPELVPTSRELDLKESCQRGALINTTEEPPFDPECQVTEARLARGGVENVKPGADLDQIGNPEGAVEVPDVHRWEGIFKEGGAVARLHLKDTWCQRMRIIGKRGSARIDWRPNADLGVGVLPAGRQSQYQRD